MTAESQELHIAGTRIRIRHRVQDLVPEIHRMFGHLEMPAEGSSTVGYTMEIDRSDSPAPIPRDPTVHMIADRLILGAVHDAVLELSDERTHVLIDYRRGHAKLTIHEPSVGGIFTAVHRLFPIALGELLRLDGRYPVHGAAVETERGGILLLGDSEAGKSTLVYRGVQSGNRCVADDGVVIHQEGNVFRLYPFYRDFNLDPRILTREDKSRSVPSEPAPDFPKVAVALTPAELSDSCVLSAAFVVQRTGEAGTTVGSCSPSQMIGQLYRQYPWLGAYPPIAPAHLDTLARLTRDVKSYTIYSGTDILQPGYTVPWDVMLDDN